MNQMLVAGARLTAQEEEAWSAHAPHTETTRRALCVLEDLSSSCPQAPLWPSESGLKLDTIWKPCRAKKESVVTLMFFPHSLWWEALQLVFKQGLQLTPKRSPLASSHFSFTATSQF